MIAYIKETSPHCFWIMPDGVAIKCATYNGNFYIEKCQFIELNLPKFVDFNLQDLMVQYGVQIGEICDLGKQVLSNLKRGIGKPSIKSMHTKN